MTGGAAAEIHSLSRPIRGMYRGWGYGRGLWSERGWPGRHTYRETNPSPDYQIIEAGRNDTNVRTVPANLVNQSGAIIGVRHWF
ncbi:hypothetical protein ACTMU2_32315 [Cupriavidus basilensis]